MVTYDFSAAFLRVDPPATSFSEAWESLCYVLLRAQHPDAKLVRLKAPDSGIDILDRTSAIAYQCKSTTQGAWGSIRPDESIASLRMAVSQRASLPWTRYIFATNALYSGNGTDKILAAASALGVSDDIDFLGPDEWERMCSQYPEAIAGKFDYRITVSEKQVIDALVAARYLPQYVAAAAEKIAKG